MHPEMKEKNNGSFAAGKCEILVKIISLTISSAPSAHIHSAKCAETPNKCEMGAALVATSQTPWSALPDIEDPKEINLGTQ